MGPLCRTHDRDVGERGDASGVTGASLGPYVDVGMRESERMVREAHRATTILEETLHAPGTQLLFRPDKRGKHRELDWRRRLPKALRFAFRR